MRVLSTMFRVAVQVAIVLIVPGGLPAVLIYQYRRLQKRRQEALAADGKETAPPARPDDRQEILPESPR